MKIIRILLLLAIPLLFAACGKNSIMASKGDANFAKSTFESLARGDSSAASKIDWATFTSMGNNIGAQYSALPTDMEKQKFSNDFITQFSTSFRESGATVESLTNWRVTFHDTTRTEVAADTKNGALVLIVNNRDNIERVSALNIVR